MQNLVKLGKTLLRYTNFSHFYQDGGRSPASLNCGAHFGTTRKKQLVGIAAVVSMIQMFEYFVHLASKRLFTPRIRVLGHLIP